MIRQAKAAAFPKFSDTLILSQPGAHPLALPHLKIFRDYVPRLESDSIPYMKIFSMIFIMMMMKCVQFRGLLSKFFRSFTNLI